jgi:crotonobetainyl-CoA:carnitine CoA-transferase CaiB-like acyl-CoA transferase
MTEGLLNGLTILDLSDCAAGQFAARIAADHGAWVALVEPPEGSPVRKLPPFRERAKEESILFGHLNGGKHSIVLDIADPSRWPDLVDLCGKVDVVIAGERKLADRLAAACPDTLVGLVTDFGPSGPYAGWQGSEMIHQALSGSMHVNGLAEREPLYGVGRRISYAAGLWLYIGLIASLCGRRQHGLTYRPVAVALHEAAAAMEENFTVRWTYSGEHLPRGGDRYRPVATYPCIDGWVTIFLRTAGEQWRDLCNILDMPELADDPRFLGWPSLFTHWGEAKREIEARTRSRTVAALIDACEKHDIVVAAIETAASLKDEAHLAHRDFWRTVETPPGPRANLGPLFRIPEYPALRDLPPPRLGVAGPMPSKSLPAAKPIVIAEEKPLPLAGIAVLDFTTAWAGPMATKILANLGADVIKVEGPRWYDSWRGPLKPSKMEQYPDSKPGERPYNRCALFNAQNFDKRAIVLDLKAPRAREIIRSMLPQIDLVVANFRPGALARQGLGYESLKAINPAISLLEMPAVGTGPFEHRIGLGPTMEAMAGIAGMIGYADGRIMGSGSSYMDPMGGLHGAAASLTTLYHRLVTGLGTYIEVAQREAAMHWVGEYLLEALDSGRQRPLAGNAIPEAAPHDAYPTGNGWIAIAVFDDDQWSGLCAALGKPEWITDPRFGTQEARLAHRAALDSLIGAATRRRNKFALARDLQVAGVPAAPVLGGQELFEDPQLRAGGWFTRLDHAEAGAYEYPGFPLRFAGFRSRPRRAAPLFGEHTEAVLSRYAGLSVKQIQELANTCVTADIPSFVRA